MNEVRKKKMSNTYKKDSLKYLEYIFYCTLFIAVITSVIFLRILFRGLFGH